jgi:hypothetical protein
MSLNVASQNLRDIRGKARINLVYGTVSARPVVLKDVYTNGTVSKDVDALTTVISRWKSWHHFFNITSDFGALLPTAMEEQQAPKQATQATGIRKPPRRFTMLTDSLEKKVKIRIPRFTPKRHPWNSRRDQMTDFLTWRDRQRDKLYVLRMEVARFVIGFNINSFPEMIASYLPDWST